MTNNEILKMSVIDIFERGKINIAIRDKLLAYIDNMIPQHYFIINYYDFDNIHSKGCVFDVTQRSIIVADVGELVTKKINKNNISIEFIKPISNKVDDLKYYISFDNSVWYVLKNSEFISSSYDGFYLKIIIPTSNKIDGIYIGYMIKI